MPRTMFQEVVCPQAGSNRKWYTVPLSLIVHALIFALVVAVPLIATDVLPMPRTSIEPYTITEVLPSPPPAVPRQAPQTAPTAVNPHAAPLEAPQGIAVESGVVLDQTVQTSSIEGLVEGFGGNRIAMDQLPATVTAPPQPVRVGGEIRPPTRIRNATPIYPFIAIQSKVQGVVIIEAIIGVDGRVVNAKVIRSVPLLDQAALDAVKSWVYTPTLLNGQPTPVIMTVTVQFKLN